MRLEEWKYAFVSATALLLLVASAPVILELIPASTGESFFALALLGEEGLAEKYYPGEEPLIPPLTPVKWNIYVYNHMGKAQQIIVKVKLADVDAPPPNSTTCEPSPATEVFEIRHVLLDNETIILPFEWTITELNKIGDTLNISRIKINGHTVNTNVSSNADQNMKMIFELWVYDKSNQEFRFGWLELGEPLCAWNQIHFSIDA